MNKKRSSRVCLAVPFIPLVSWEWVRWQLFIAYFEPAGTSMLRVAMPGLEGGVLPAAILLRLRTSACQEGIFFVVMWRRACLVR